MGLAADRHRCGHLNRATDLRPEGERRPPAATSNARSLPRTGGYTLCTTLDGLRSLAQMDTHAHVLHASVHAHCAPRIRSLPNSHISGFTIPLPASLAAYQTLSRGRFTC